MAEYEARCDGSLDDNSDSKSQHSCDYERESSKSDKEVVIQARDDETYDVLMRRLLEAGNENRHLMKILHSLNINYVAAVSSKGTKETRERYVIFNHDDDDVHTSQLKAVLQELIDAIEQVKVKKLFKESLERLKSTLNLLKPIIKMAHRYFSSQELLHLFILPLEKGVELVNQCSKTSPCLCLCLCTSNNNRKDEWLMNSKIVELDVSLRMFCRRLIFEATNNPMEPKLDVVKVLNLISNIETVNKEIKEKLKYLGGVEL